MKERPILFSGALVRAILEGCKSQTRRIVTTREPLQFIGGRGEEADPDKWGWFFDGPDHHGYMVLGRGHDERHDHGLTSIPCPYGAPGDRLWVKETIRRVVVSSPELAVYAADGAPTAIDAWPWKRDVLTAIHTPRGASRITLEVTDVRVQRLQAISEDDARAEGVEPYTPPHGHISPDQRVPGPGFDRCRLGDQPHRLPFADLWDSINGKRAPWSSNPWVWALTFRRLP